MDFYVVYLQEIHPSDGWQVQENREDGVVIALIGDRPPSDALALALQERLVDVLELGDGEAFDAFGFKLALSAGTAHIGALGDDDNGTDSGAPTLAPPTCSTWRPDNNSSS